MKEIPEVEAEARRTGMSYGAYVYKMGLARAVPKTGQRACRHCGRAFTPRKPADQYCTLRCRLHAELRVP